jgi:hypothetical protein
VIQSHITAELSLFHEFRKLEEVGVLEWQPTSEWVAPLFIKPKKKGTVQIHRNSKG